MTKQLTEKQQAVLDCLFDKGIDGNLSKAIKAAGYAGTIKPAHIRESLASEIIEATKEYLAVNAPTAAVGLVSILNNPTELGNKDKLAAAKDLLDRMGFKAKEEVEVTTNSNVFILPSKDGTSD